MVKVPDEVQFGVLARKAASALGKAGFDHRIDIYRDLEIEDPVVLKMLGQPHRVRVRVQITAQSLLFSRQAGAVPSAIVTAIDSARRALHATNAAPEKPMLRRTGS